MKNKIGLPGGSFSKETVCSAGHPGSIFAFERSPGEWNDNPLQHSCLENPVEREAGEATAHGVAKSQIELRD